MKSVYDIGGMPLGILNRIINDFSFTIPLVMFFICYVSLSKKMRSMLAKEKLPFIISGCQRHHTELRAELIGLYNNTNKLSGTIFGK
jgi:hypothetical protein